MCGPFVATATGSEMALEEQAPPSPRSMLSDVVLCISCDYEDNTDWGKDIGWMYGSVTEDILSGMKIHSRGWRSQYCDPDRPAFKVTLDSHTAPPHSSPFQPLIPQLRVRCQRFCRGQRR